MATGNESSMVLPDEGDHMPTVYERLEILHNFPNLKCIKVDSDGFSGAGDQRLRPSTSEFKGATTVRFVCSSDQRNQNLRLKTEPSRSTEDGVEEGIEEFREKVMPDLITMADKMRKSIFRKQALGNEEEEEQINYEKERQKEEKPRGKERVRKVSLPEAPGAAVQERPWNLRKRRAVCKATIPEDENQYKGLRIDEKREMNWTRWRETKEQPKFLSTLSKKEIKDDYMKMTGHPPPRRPKKRPKNVQKHVDLLYPASYFTKITEDMYEVQDTAENRKR